MLLPFTNTVNLIDNVPLTVAFNNVNNNSSAAIYDNVDSIAVVNAGSGSLDFATNWSNYTQMAAASITAAIAISPSTPTTTSSIYDYYNQSLIDCCNLSGNNSSGNVTNSTKYGDETISFVLPWWRQMLWSLLFGGMVIVATGGNLIVVWIVMTTKRMRTVTNYFIVNLSIADAMVSSLNVPFSYIFMLYNDWAFGELYCKVSQFIATLSISASVFTLMAISIDRYVAIMKPLQPRMSKRSNLAIAAVIWITSTIISCPMLLFYTTVDVFTSHGRRTVCYTVWPDGETNHSTMEYFYNIVFMILTYFVPIISMTVTYARVGFELWGSKAIGEYTPRQVENVRSKRRVVKMMIVVVLIFAFCWLPFHAYFIVTSCYPIITIQPYIQEVYLLIYWLAMSNSMYNPIIYCWMNSRFRFGFKMFFRWCPFVNIGAESLNRRDNMTSRYSCSGSPDHNRIKRNDTQKSILYACPSSPKSRRISHCGMLRSTTVLSGRDMMRYSTPMEDSKSKSTYYQQNQQLTPNSHEMYGLSGKSPLQRDLERTAGRQKWATTSASGVSNPNEQNTTQLMS